MYYVLFTVVFFLFPCGGHGVDDSFKIFRSEHDIFTNLQCSGGCTELHCQIYRANCVGDGNCKYCICNISGMNTFIRNEADPTKGECKGDEEIVPESVPNEGFLIQRQGYDQCIKAYQSAYIKGSGCSSPTLDMLWIWTDTEDALLMNIQTLQCMQGNLYTSWDGRPSAVSMEQCQENFNSQKMTCFDNVDETKVTIGWHRWARDDVADFRYLHLNNENHIVARIGYEQIWNNKKQECNNKTTYTGCYRYSDGSFMKYLHYNETNPKLQISAPIFQNNDHQCTVQKYFHFIRDGQKWNSRNEDNIFVAQNNGGKYEIKFKTTEHFKAWNGSLLKLSVKCHEEEHCVLLKLESYPNYSEDVNIIPRNPNTPQSVSSETDSSIVAIAVTVILLVALMLALGFFFYYRRRKRQQISQNNNTADRGTVNSSGQSSEDPFYETLGGNGGQNGNTSNAYSYPYDNTVAKPATEHEYTYAKETNTPRKTEGQKAAEEGQGDGGPLYHTLEEPSRADDLYNSPYDTKIAKSSSTELEYAYAKVTDNPKLSAINKTVVSQQPTKNAVHDASEEDPASNDVYKIPGVNIPTEPEYTYAKDAAKNAVYDTSEEDPASNDVYKIPGVNIPTVPEYTYAKDAETPKLSAINKTIVSQKSTSEEDPASNDEYKVPGVNIPTVPEYTYVKDTDIPRTKANSSAAYNNPLYHTLQEQNPPLAPAYPTLEGPDH